MPARTAAVALPRFARVWDLGCADPEAPDPWQLGTDLVITRTVSPSTTRTITPWVRWPGWYSGVGSGSPVL